jgi:hypothetical protein
MEPNTLSSENDVYPNLLLITGSGRERGKTMLACNIISIWKKNHDLVAIKISAHLHEDPRSVNLIHQTNGYAIWEEIAVSPKDSGRFLEAGAGKVYYIEAHDMELLEVFRFIYGLCSEKSMIVCESGGLGRLIKPAVMLFVQHENDTVVRGKEAIRNICDRIVYSSSPEILDPSLFLEIANHRWKLLRDDRDETLSTFRDPPAGSGFENNSA